MKGSERIAQLFDKLVDGARGDWRDSAKIFYFMSINYARDLRDDQIDLSRRMIKHPILQVVCGAVRIQLKNEGFDVPLSILFAISSYVLIKGIVGIDDTLHKFVMRAVGGLVDVDMDDIDLGDGVVAVHMQAIGGVVHHLALKELKRKGVEPELPPSELN